MCKCDIFELYIKLNCYSLNKIIHGVLLLFSPLAAIQGCLNVCSYNVPPIYTKLLPHSFTRPVAAAITKHQMVM